MVVPARGHGLFLQPAAAHIALDVGGKRQAEWLRGMGFFAPVPVELPEAARPLVPRQWGLATTMTVGFGHGVAEPPLAIVRGTAATVNGGILVTPTLLDQEDPDPPAPDASPAEEFEQGVQSAALRQTLPTLPTGTGAPMPEAPVIPQGVRVLSESNSALLRRLLRLDVTQGTGRTAESPGYFVGGKTGTAEKIGPHGGYLKHVNISAFTSIFPMNAPRYAVYVMLDSPQPTPRPTAGQQQAGTRPPQSRA